MDNGKKTYTEGIKVESKFAKWFDNYWYHYKWITIGIVFFIAVVIICTLQMGEKKKEDITILYAGPYQLSAREVNSLQGVFNAVMPEDFDESGEKHTSIVEYLIYSDEQIKEIEAQTDADGHRLDVNNQSVTDNYKNYYDYIVLGETAICLVDEHLYGELSKYGRLLPLVTALGEDSGYESDDYGLYLGSTGLYKEYSALRVLPKDTVICILRQTVVGKISKDENYQHELDMFKAIVNYGKDAE